MQKGIENHQYLKSLSNLYLSEICPHCSSSSLIKIDETVYLCQVCDNMSGFDDSMSFYDIENFLDGTPVEEFLSDIYNNAYEVKQSCSTCGNKDPDKMIFQFKKDLNEISFICFICKNYLDDDVKSRIFNENENKKCKCEKDIGFLQREFDKKGNFIKSRCKNCTRVIISDDENSASGKYKLEEDVSYNGRVKVDSLYLLTEGCHVAWHRLLSYWHHGIVTKVFYNSNKIEVIHFSSSNFPTNKGTVLKEILDVDVKKDQMYRIDYKKQVYSSRQVIERAESKLGQTDYNLFKNNCEHFANWCKTGVSESAQVSSFEDKLRYKEFNTDISEVEDGLSMLEYTLGTLQSYGPIAKHLIKISSKYSIEVAVICEIINTNKDIKNSKKDYNSGKIEKKEFIKINIQRICQTTGTIIGAFLSFAIPLPLRNIFLPFSMLIGKGVGNFVGKQISSMYDIVDRVIYEKWLTKNLHELEIFERGNN